MKKFLSLSYNRSAVLTATAATFALLGTVGISSAKKGGGGKPGGGEDPPPPPPPLGELPQISPNAIEYEARFFDAANPDDWGQSDVPTWSTPTFQPPLAVPFPASLRI